MVVLDELGLECAHAFESLASLPEADMLDAARWQTCVSCTTSSRLVQTTLAGRRTFLTAIGAAPLLGSKSHRARVEATAAVRSSLIPTFGRGGPPG
jgi:hypothetical protein